MTRKIAELSTTTITAVELITIIDEIGIENIYSGGRCEACPLTGECEDLLGKECFGYTPIYYDKSGEEHKLPAFIMKGSELAKLPLPYKKSSPVSFKLYEVKIHTVHDEETTLKGEVIETHRYKLSYKEV